MKLGIYVTRRNAWLHTLNACDSHKYTARVCDARQGWWGRAAFVPAHSTTTSLNSMDYIHKYPPSAASTPPCPPPWIKRSLGAFCRRLFLSSDKSDSRCQEKDPVLNGSNRDHNRVFTEEEQGACSRRRNVWTTREAGEVKLKV
ncbi:hypothetical protein J6590_044417 [Homalodisca vitripennis]|nr:hypothetical protein J6590_044417 [Homalodisca vitripennis]